MKKILISTVAVATLFAYEGCGLNKKEALNALSQSIYVNVSNNFQKKEELNNNGYSNKVNKNIKTETSQSSNLTLKNVKYITKQNNQICAIVSEKDILNSANSDLQFLLAYNSAELPQSFKEKQKTVTDLLTKIKFVKAIGKPNSKQIEKLNKLEKQLKDLANVGEIVFNTNIPNSKIKISGQEKYFSPSESILLPAGEYSYTITASNKCPVVGNFSIQAKQNYTINKDLGDYPVLTFTSNQKKVNVKLDGKTVDLNAPIMLKKCDGKAVWNMSFEDQYETGDIELSPSLKDSVNRDFTPRLTMKKIREKVDYYTKSKEVVISYGYGISNKHTEWDKEKRIEVRQFNNYGMYKLGFGVLGGTKDKWTAKEMNELEIAISGRIQIPELADTNFHFYRMPVIPYIGVEGGWDFYKFIDKGNYDADDITSIFRGTAGITFLLHKQFGFNIEYSHDFMEKKDNIFGAGIVLDF